MDTRKPPIYCSACGDPIWPADLGLVKLSDEPDEDGMYLGLAYHKKCEPAELNS